MVCKYFLPLHKLSFEYCLFSLLGKSFYLIPTQLSIFAFVHCAFGVTSKKRLLPRQMLWNFPLMCSSKSFSVSCLSIWFFNPFWVDFFFFFFLVYRVRKGINFIILCMDIQLSQYHLMKRLPLLHCVFLASFPLIGDLHGSKWILGLFLLFLQKQKKSLGFQ